MSKKTGENRQTISIEQKQFDAFIKAMQSLVKVYAARQIKRDVPTAINARFLRVFDLSQQEIADLLGITQQAVNEALSKTKRDRTKPSPKMSDGTSPKGSDDTVEKT